MRPLVRTRMQETTMASVVDFLALLRLSMACVVHVRLMLGKMLWARA